MAKKILAVVLAVMMALSAMAITAFADDIIIDMKALNPYQAQAKNHLRITFDIPVWGTYGYLTAGDYMELDLPRYFGKDVPVGKKIDWYLEIDGKQYPLQRDTTSDVSGDVSTNTNRVYLGVYAHGWNGTDTTIPQTTGFNALNSFRLVGTIEEFDGKLDWAGNLANPVDIGALFTNNGAVYGNTPSTVKADWFRADGTPVVGSTSYVLNWTPQVNDLNSTPATLADFVSAEWTNDLNWGNASTAAAHPLTWDHTIKNRSEIYSYTGDTAVLVVELAKPIVGYATYTLWTRNTNSLFGDYNSNNLWWNFKDQRELVATINVNDANSPRTELRFEVPIKYLLEREYGAYNTEFAILENITLMNNSLMSDYRHANTAVAGEDKSYGPLSWGKKSPWGTEPVIKLNGNELNYARSGAAGSMGADVTATNIYILLPEVETDDSNVDIDNPQQDTGNVTDDPADGDEMNAGDQTEDPKEEDTTPAPSESENPPTGIALAVIPMILAAAAAVVAKKH